MNIEWFNGFLEASKHKSFTKASEKLNISQPALSKQIRNLEQTLQVELFRRTALGIELTEEGALFYDRIQPILTEIESLRKDLINLNLISSIRLAALPSLATYYLPNKLLELSRQGINVEMNVLSTTGEIIALLQNGLLDVGIVQKSDPLPESYWNADLFQELFYAIIPEPHHLYDRNCVTITDLKDEPLIVYPNHCDVRTSVAQAYKICGFDPHFSTELAFGESIPGFVAAGAGISILPEIIAMHLSHTNLKAIPIDGFPVTRTISMISRKPSIGKRLIRFF